MDIDQIKSILELVREHGLAEFEIEHDGLRLKVRRDAAGHLVSTLPAAHVTPAHPAMAMAAAPAQAGGPGAVVAAEAADTDVQLAVVKSPIVGTFYRSPEPGAPPFAEIGAKVKKGQVLCIIEAMKLMNEIDSEYEGEVVKAYVENGQAVQYGERLFAIKTA